MKKTITFLLNGEPQTVTVRHGDTLLEVLRKDLGLKGTKYGCGHGDCGACTVLLDGRAVPSCLVLAVRVDGHRVETVEGLEREGKLHPLQEAFLREGAVQCGYCTPGMLMSAKALLDENPRPSEEEVRLGLAGNLCRCTGYQKIVRAVLAAAEDMNRSGGNGRGSAVLVIHPDDNVGVAVRPLAPGEEVEVGDRLLKVQDPIPVGHKLALQFLPAGEYVRKYGSPIGRARVDIAPGSHVHDHNLEDISEEVLVDPDEWPEGGKG